MANIGPLLLDDTSFFSFFLKNNKISSKDVQNLSECPYFAFHVFLCIQGTISR